MKQQEYINILEKGRKVWNKWRAENKNVRPKLKDLYLDENLSKKIDLSNADLQGIETYEELEKMNFSNSNLSKMQFYECFLFSINFSHANLSKGELAKTEIYDSLFNNVNAKKAEFGNAKIYNCNFTESKLQKTDFSFSTLIDCNLSNADLAGADFRNASIINSNLSGANLTDVNLSNADLTGSNFSNTTLVNTDLTKAKLVATNFQDAKINNCRIYGASVWDLKGQIKEQKNIILTPPESPDITTDNIEVAQFIYLLLNNTKIRDVIGTIAQKGVLILGRFSPKRKKILDAIREKLRASDFVPMMFDFEKIDARDYTETVKILAGMSRFVIVDITHQSSCPLELQATVPDFKIPFMPIILEGEKPFAMLIDLIRKYEWVTQVLTYKSEDELLSKFNIEIIQEALSLEKSIKEKERVSYFRE